MPFSIHTLAVTAQHPLGVFQVGGLQATTVTVLSGSEVFYGEQNLTADEHYGSLQEGKSKTFISPTWLLSNHSSRVEVRDYTPEHAFEQLKVGRDGTVGDGPVKEPVAGVTVDKPKRVKREVSHEEKQREHIAVPHREDPRPDRSLPHVHEHREGPKPDRSLPHREHKR
jgi:hypothetical protein